MKKDDIQEAEFVEIDRPVDTQDETENESEGSPFVPMQARIIFKDGDILKFTISDLDSGDFEGWQRWIRNIMAQKTEDGFFIANLFIQDSKVKHFEMVS